MRSFFTKVVYLLIFVCVMAHAEVFVVNKINFIGLHRISLQTARNYLSVKEGDKVDSNNTSAIIRSLYRTGFFNDVDLIRENNDLLITVKERPVIEAIVISGNKEVTTKQILELLKQARLIEGQAYDAATVKIFEQQLTQQYYNVGHNYAKVNVVVTQDTGSKVTIKVVIDEGAEAKIREIRFIGNKAFPEKKLIKQLSLTTPSLFTFFTHSDQYTREKLDADLEKIRGFYLDQGYLKFKIESSEATITPDKKHIYITIKVFEGEQYKIGGFDIEGKIPDGKAKLLSLIKLKVGQVFSRVDILNTNMVITQYLGKHGFGMPTIKALPEIDEVKKTVFVKFAISSGKRTYVRRIHFVGNSKTQEVVLRREMRQQEGALLSLDKMNESRRRLENLGYLQGADTKLEPVPGSPDQVDLTIGVKETSSASANFSLGFSDTDGLLYGISVNERNFLGSGKILALGFNHSTDYQNYSFNYVDPYFTPNNISMSLTAYVQRHTPGSVNLSSYTTQIYGLSNTFGIPISDFNRLSFGYGVERIEIETGKSTSKEVLDFIHNYGNNYNELRFPLSWTFSNTDRAIFPTRGLAQSLTLEIAAPLDRHGLGYFKTDYLCSWYYPLVKNFIFKAHGEIGYGNGYGKLHNLPFFKNFYAGGIDSVHGFEPYSLGPLDTRSDPADKSRYPMGGNFLTVGSIGLVVPNPLGDTLRTSAFVDVGNVYDKSFTFDELRSSVGVQAEWRSPMGLLVFSLAKPIKKQEKDRTEVFQFSMGTSF